MLGDLVTEMASQSAPDGSICTHHGHRADGSTIVRAILPGSMSCRGCTPRKRVSRAQPTHHPQFSQTEALAPGTGKLVSPPAGRDTGRRAGARRGNGRRQRPVAREPTGSAAIDRRLPAPPARGRPLRPAARSRHVPHRTPTATPSCGSRAGDTSAQAKHRAVCVTTRCFPWATRIDVSGPGSAGSQSAGALPLVTAAFQVAVRAAM